MTTAGGGGGSGIEYGDDSVVARLAVDIPEGSAQGVREITQEVERFRVTMEATTRAEADMTRYLSQMSEAGKRATEVQNNLTQSMQTYLSLAGRMSGGSYYGPTASGVPSGPAQQPFSGATTGMGGQAAFGPYRPPNPSDVSSQLASMPQANQREYLNMQQVRGNINAGDLVSLSPTTIQDLTNKLSDREKALSTQREKTDGNPPAVEHTAPRGEGGSITDKIAGGAGLAGQVMHEMGPRGENMNMGNMMVQGLNWASKRFSAQAAGRPGPPSSSGSYPEGMPPEGAPGMGSASPSGAPEAEATEDATEKGTAGLSGFTKLLGPVAGVATAALSIFGLIQKGGEEIQGMRNVGGIRGGAAGEGFSAESKERMLAAMNPFINRDQARQIFQAAMSEGYADASGAGADNVVDFMKTNLTNMNISVADSMKMLRGTITGNQKGDPDSVNGAVTMLREELDTIKTMSRSGIISTPDYTKNVMALQQQLMAGGASPDSARNTAMLAEQVGSGDHVLANQFAGDVGGLAGSVQGQGMLRIWGGAAIPAGLDPEATAGYLSDKGELGGASMGVMKHLAMLARQRDNGSEYGRRNAITYFQRLLKHSPMANSQAAQDYGAAAAQYDSLVGGGDGGLGQASSQLAEHPMNSTSGLTESYSPPEGAGALPTPTPPSSGGGNSAGATSGTDVPSIRPFSGAGGSSGGGGGGGNVTVDLTPAASRLLTVLNSSSSLTPTQRAANAGVSGAAVNDPPR